MASEQRKRCGQGQVCQGYADRQGFCHGSCQERSPQQKFTRRRGLAPVFRTMSNADGEGASAVFGNKFVQLGLAGLAIYGGWMLIKKMK